MALRDAPWTLEPGSHTTRSKLKAAFGGGIQGGVVISTTSSQLMIFSGVLFARVFGFAPETLFDVPAAEHAAIDAAPEVKL